MGQTYYIADAMNLVTRHIPRVIEADFAAHLANMAQNVMWMKYDWRETISFLPPFWLLPYEQDYGAPYYAVPTDFLGLREAYLVTVQNAANAPLVRKEIRVVKDVRDTFVADFPQVIGYVPATGKIRVFPRVPTNITSSQWLIEGTYKKKPTKILPSGLQNTLIPWDDIYFQVFVAGLKWAALDAAGDPKAGEVQYSDGRAVLTGQLARFHALIDDMAANEGFELGDPAIAPAESLTGVGYFGGYSAYPGMLV